MHSTIYLSFNEYRKKKQKARTKERGNEVGKTVRNTGGSNNLASHCVGHRENLQ